MTTPTTTSALSPSTVGTGVAHITPAPECSATPYFFYPYLPSLDCSSLSLAPRQPCPTGWTTACEEVVHSTSHWRSRSPTWALGPDGTTSEIRMGETWSTEEVQIVCCPDVLDYKCATSTLFTPECSVYVPAPTLVTFQLPGRPPSSVQITTAETYYGFPAWASYARVSLASVEYSAGAFTTVVPTGREPFTTWCSSRSCYDLPTGFTTEGDAAATLLPKAEYSQRPPPGMGGVGTLGIFGVSALLGGLFFAAGTLAPWVWAYRQRRRQQRVTQ